MAIDTLLTAEDGPPCDLFNEDGDSDFVLVCDHASNRVPRALTDLGAAENVLNSHAGWDPGAQPLARLMSRHLNAPLLTAGFSRLVIDVNRPPGSPESIRSQSERHHIPGNNDLVESEKQARATELYEPFHQSLAGLIDRRERRSKQTVLITIHTFTPIYFGAKRKVEIGIVHDDDGRLANRLLELTWDDFIVERNQPYGPQDGVTHTLSRHALPRRLHNVMIEVRNDLVGTLTQQQTMAERLAGSLRQAVGARRGNQIEGAISS